MRPGEAGVLTEDWDSSAIVVGSSFAPVDVDTS